MSKNVWWWIRASVPREPSEPPISDALPACLVPIGRPLDDGVNYPTNPRFDGAGRWRRRKEWPSDLQ